MQAVAFTDLIVAVRDQHVSAVFHRADKQFDLEPRVHIRKRDPDQFAVLRDRIFDQLHSSLYKCLDLAGIREQQQSADLIRYDQFRVHCHAQMEVFLQKPDLLEIDRVSHARNRMSCPEPPGNQAAQHIALVRRRTGDHKVRVGHVRLLLNLRICRIAGHAGDIQTVNGIF